MPFHKLQVKPFHQFHAQMVLPSTVEFVKELLSTKQLPEPLAQLVAFLTMELVKAKLLDQLLPPNIANQDQTLSEEFASPLSPTDQMLRFHAQLVANLTTEFARL